MLLGLVACELLLQVITLVNRTLRSRAGAAAPDDGDSAVWICVGDSNTFGVFEDTRDAYPAQLERLLGERAGARPVRVVNLGLPGSNTRQVLEVLERAVREHEPEVALVLVGVNNAWSWQPNAAIAFEDPPWYERLRLVRLTRLFLFSFERLEPRDDRDLLLQEVDPVTGDMRVAGRDRTGRRVKYAAVGVGPKRETAELEASIVDGLAAMARRFEGGACRLVFLTYAADEGWYAPANRAIREAARETGTLLVDCERALAPSREHLPTETLFYPDYHPRALGYELLARAALQGLAEGGVIEAQPFPSLDEDLVTLSLSVPAPRLVFEPGATGLPVVEIDSQDPARLYVVLLSEAQGERRVVLGGLELPVFDDALHQDTRLAPALRGSTDGEGRARVSLAGLVADEQALDRLRGRRFRVAYVLLQNRYGAVRRVSAAAEFELR